MAHALIEDAVSPRPRYAAPALEKGFDILELLADVPNGLTSSEIAQRLGRSLSEVFRIILVMERRGWLWKHPDSDRYQVTYRVLDVGFRGTPVRSLTDVAVPIMAELAAQANQSCHLVVRAKGRGLVVQRQENAGPAGFAMRLGAIIDLVSSCSGHVLLAFEEEEGADEVLKGLLEDATARKKLKRRWQHVRAQGYEMQPSARAAGVTDISFPVFGFDGRIAAALTVPYLQMIDGSQTVSSDETRDRLSAAATRLSLGLGWSG